MLIHPSLSLRIPKRIIMLKERVYRLAGDDWGIIRNCNYSTQSRFFRIGLFVPLIFIFCFFSSFYTFRHLFGSLLFSLCFSLFFSWMISNIYRLLLYTLTKSALPDFKYRTSGVSALFVRVISVCFISLIISVPIESCFYSDVLDEDMNVHRTNERKSNREKIMCYYQLQYNEIKKLSKDRIFVAQFIERKERERLWVTDNMYHLVDASNYYLQRIRFLCTRHRSCWFITGLFMLLFNLPVYMKYAIQDSDYYQKKGVIEQRIVEVNYYAFKRIFSSIFKRKYELDLMFCEPYKDAPYNMIRKSDDRSFLTENQFLSELYNGKA